MTFQDEFIHRLRVQRGEAAGDGEEDSGRSTGSGRTGERESRHPELVSGPREGEPEDRGERHEVLNRQAIADKRVQDDEGSNTVSPEPVEGRLSDEKRGSTGSPLTDTPPSPTTRHDGWLPDIRVKFLEALAQTGNVQASAYFVQRSRQSAYDLKRRDPDFARAWLAALVLAREEAQDRLQERAIEGIEEPVYYHGEVVGMRRRYDSRLLLAHLARLDRLAEQIPAQRGAARFGAMLEAIGKGEDTAPLIATPTEDELATLAGAAEALPEAGSGPGPDQEDDLPEFYAVCDPGHDDAPCYYRMTLEEAAEIERDCPGVTATPTGIRRDAEINALPWHLEATFEGGGDAAEKGIYL